MKNHFKALLLVSVLLISSCANNKGWVYKPNEYSESSHHNSSNKSKTVAVLPFADKRSNVNKNAIMMYAIPLFPFGFQNMSSPETVPQHANSGLWVNYNPKEDFAKAMAEELNSARIFKESYFSNSVGVSNYYVSGEILSTDYKSKLFSYGLSIYGPLLWYVGLPATHVANDLEVKLTLFDSSSRKALFSKSYKAQDYKKLGWIYNLPNDFYYPEMLKSLYKNFIEDFSKNNK